MEVAGLVWATALILATVFALDPASSAPRLNKALLVALVPLAAYHTVDAANGMRALALLLLSATFASAYGIADFVLRGASFLSRARGPSGHYMTYGGQLLLVIGLAAAIVLLVRGRWRWLAATTLGFSTVALAATYTRSAWLGAAASLTVIVARARPRWLPVLLVAMAAVSVLGPSEYRERLTSAFDPGHPRNVERTYMWQAGWRIFLDHPVTGVGLQDLAPVYDRYRPPQAQERVGHLHNTVVQIAASTGLVGLVAFLWLVIAMFRTAGHGLPFRVRSASLAAAVRLGTVASLVGFLVAGLFEWNLGDEELVYYLYTMIGLAWGARRWDADDAKAGALREAGAAASERT